MIRRKLIPNPGDRVAIVAPDQKTVRGVVTVKEATDAGMMTVEGLPKGTAAGDFLLMIDPPQYPYWQIDEAMASRLGLERKGK